MLREYQQDCLNSILKDDCSKGLCVLPTGAGKSHIIAELHKHYNAVTVAPRVELVAQNNHKGATCYTVNMIYRHPKHLCKDADTLIIDEAHLVNRWEGMYYNVMKRFNRVIGFTATPYRLRSGLLIPKTFEKIIYEIKREELIKKGYLTKRHFNRIPAQYLINVRKKSWDDSKGMSKDARDATPKCLDYFFERYPGGKVLFFGCDLKHVEKIQEMIYSKTAIEVPFISSQTGKYFRTEIINNFKTGKIKMLINCEILTTGFDCPDLQHIVILRPTESYTLYEQICGRGDRIADNKTQNEIWDFTISGFNFAANGDKPTNYEKACLLCGEKTDYRYKSCTHCQKPLLRGEPILKACAKCGTEIQSRAVYCPHCGSFTKDNIQYIEGNNNTIKILRQSNKKFMINFNSLWICNLSWENAKIVYDHRERNDRFEVFYKKDFKSGKNKIIKMNFYK